MRAALVLLLGTFLCAGVASAYDNTGADPSNSFEFETYPGRSCTVYMYGDPMGESARFTGLGYIVTTGFDLSLANISNYDLVLIPCVGPGVIAGFAGDLDTYVAGGGGLFIHQPNHLGVVDYAPAGFACEVTDTWWCEPYDANTIVDPTHPTMAGLTDPDLAGRFDTMPVGLLGTGYTLVAEGAMQCAGHTCCAAGCYGEGHVFLDAANLSSASGDPGSDAYVINVFEWLCAGGVTPTGEETWGKVKSVFR